MRPAGSPLVLVAIILAAKVMGFAMAAPVVTPAVTSHGCRVTFASPTVVPITGAIGGVVIDDGCNYAYLTNTTFNRVEVYSLHSLSLEAPIQVGAQPVGVDLTPDGTRLYVANSGGNNISVVDTAQRVELRKIPVPGGSLNYTPQFIAIANNGLALFTMAYAGSGWPPMMQLNLATEAVSQRLDFWFSGSSTEPTFLSASTDRSVIGIAGGNISSGPVFRYTAATNTFSPEKPLNAFLSDVSADMTGSTLVVSPGTWVLDAALSLNGTVLGGPAFGNAQDPTWGIGYRSRASQIDILNLSTFLETGQLALGASVSSAATYNSIGRMEISSDGALLAVITNTGFSLVRPFDVAPEGPNLVRNGSFGSALTRWRTYATPTMASIVGGVVNGVFDFYRVPPAPGTTNQAVVFQETGMPLPAGASVEAQFDLGNSSSVRKRLSVLLLDADFSDLHVCTFWLPPNLPLTTYAMRTHTTEAWSSAAIYFYAATPGSDGGAYRLDNVTLRHDTTLAVDRTECEDPSAPLPSAGSDGPELAGNGGFENATLAPWLLFGTITSQVSGGVLEFIRPTPAPPAGVVFQKTGIALAAGDIVTASFELGNSSAVRKRVTVLLHEGDFSDLSACTFWLPPSQPLSAYTMRAFATQAWTDATISIYAATIGAEQWTRVDNVTLRHTPSAALAGTDCVEPAAPPPGGFRAAVLTTAISAAASGRSRAGASAHVMERIGQRTDEVAVETGTAIDLSGAVAARLRFESWSSAPLQVLVMVSTDGRWWTTVASVEPSDHWQPKEIDLSGWIGTRLMLRFAPDAAAAAPDVWRIRQVTVEITR